MVFNLNVWLFFSFHITKILFFKSFEIGANEIDIMGFEPQVNQRLLPPTFPRYTQLRCRSEAIENLIQFMDRLKTMCKIKDHANFHAALVLLSIYLIALVLF